MLDCFHRGEEKMKADDGVDQIDCGLGSPRRPGLSFNAGTGLVLGVLQAGTIVMDHLLGTRLATLIADLVATGTSLLILSSIDKAKTRREELARAERALEDASRRRQEAAELVEASLAARRAQAEADEANRAKTDFLASMSHEIRTPLNSVIGFASLLLQQPNLAPQARLFGERIQAGGAALLTVVNDILDFSQVEAGMVALEHLPFSLHGLVDECVSLVQHAAVAKHLSLHVSLVDRLPAGVCGDAARLRQILLNLLNNAIKFTVEGSVTLDIRRDRASADSDRIIFSVIDTGIGIARADQAKLFQRFAQVDASVRRTHGGTGLGLVISQQLVELMGGVIGVDSQKDAGATFFFSVPLPSASLPADDVTVLPASSFASRRVLLVEDVATNQDLVRHILGTRDYIVDIVGNGTEAVMAVQDMAYDVVLMDVQMPFLDGLAATRMIRALGHPCRDVPIVAITANVLPEQTAAAREAGMIDVIHKPFSAAQMFAVLDRVAGAGAEVDVEVTLEGEAQDAAIIGKLAELLGDAKIRSLLKGLAASLARQFSADPATVDGRAELRRQAHASVAGSGMLGFTAFSLACKAFQTSPEDDGFATRFAALKRQAALVQEAATRLAEQTENLTRKVA